MTENLPSLSDLDRELAIRSLAEFTKQAWHVLEPGTKLAWGWHLDAICDHLEAVSDGRIKRLLINIPPGHMKSLLVTVFWPAWQWLRKPEWRSIFTTYAQTLSVRDSVRCRDVIQSPWYQSLFSPDWKMASDQNVKGYFANSEKGFRLALSVGGQGTGFRGDVVVFDDPMNVSEYPSADTLDNIVSWWDKRMSSRLNDMATGAFVGIMQRIHESDLCGHLLSKKGEKWEHLCLPSEFEPETRCKTSLFEDPRTKRGELLFEAKFPRQVIEQSKIDLGDQYDAQHQQRPSAQGGGIFQRKHWRFWYPSDANAPDPIITEIDGEKHEHVQIPLPQIMSFKQSWDLAFKKSSGSDFVAGQVWGVGRVSNGAAFFLLDQVHDRLSFTETVEEFEALTQKWPKCDEKFVEDKANGPALIDMLSGRIPGIVPVNPQGGKEARAHAAAPAVKAGTVYLPHPAFAPWVKKLLDELTKFPKAAHDDSVDALTQALNRMRNDSSIMLLSLTKGRI